MKVAKEKEKQKLEATAKEKEKEKETTVQKQEVENKEANVETEEKEKIGEKEQATDFDKLRATFLDGYIEQLEILSPQFENAEYEMLSTPTLEKDERKTSERAASNAKGKGKREKNSYENLRWVPRDSQSSRRVFVKDFPIIITKEQALSLFSQFGKVERVWMDIEKVKVRGGGTIQENTGRACVLFSKGEEAKRAIKEGVTHGGRYGLSFFACEELSWMEIPSFALECFHSRGCYTSICCLCNVGVVLWYSCTSSTPKLRSSLALSLSLSLACEACLCFLSASTYSKHEVFSKRSRQQLDPSTSQTSEEKKEGEEEDTKKTSTPKLEGRGRDNETKTGLVVQLLQNLLRFLNAKDFLTVEKGIAFITQCAISQINHDIDEKTKSNEKLKNFLILRTPFSKTFSLSPRKVDSKTLEIKGLIKLTAPMSAKIDGIHAIFDKCAILFEMNEDGLPVPVAVCVQAPS